MSSKSHIPALVNGLNQSVGCQVLKALMTYRCIEKVYLLLNSLLCWQNKINLIRYFDCDMETP
jgi:ABC-type thiamin/hydroxymethylpyrimidine transport system permease subunit